MALPSLDGASTAAGNTVGGAVRYVTAPLAASGVVSPVAKAAEGVASGLATGAVRAGVSAIDNVVGGAENRRLIEQGAGAVVSGVKSLFNGGSVTDAAGGFVNGAQRAVVDSVDRLVGGSENRQLIQQAAGKVYDGAKDLLTGKQTISGLFSSKKPTDAAGVAGAVSGYGEVNGMCVGPVGGVDLVGGFGSLGALLQGNEGSDWGNLSRHRIARIYACDADGVALVSEPLGVSGPASDVNFESTLNWQSPFESTGPEAKAPALMAMLQSGSLVPVINAIQAVNPIQNDAINGVLNDAAGKAKQIAKDLEGRTGITKLNSRQVFSGMPPIKVTLTLHFRAMFDSMAEVVEPYQRLLEFSMPQGLAADGVLTEVIASTGSENSSLLKAMFPSVAPLMVGFIYGNNRYPAMVIETVSNPLDGPMDSEGRPIFRSVQLTLATLTALDRADIKKLFV